MSKMKSACPNCSASFAFSPEQIGRRGMCPRCKFVFRIGPVQDLTGQNRDTKSAAVGRQIENAVPISEDQLWPPQHNNAGSSFTRRTYWWQNSVGVRFGPFAEVELQQLIDAGQLPIDANVWSIGWPNWKSISEFIKETPINADIVAEPTFTATIVVGPPKLSATTQPKSAELPVAHQIRTIQPDSSQNLAQGVPVVWLAITLAAPWLFIYSGPPIPLIFALVLAVAGSASGCWLLTKFCAPQRCSECPEPAILGWQAFAFTAVCGIVLLLVFQEVAEWAVASEISIYGKGKFGWVIGIIKFIGWMYKDARDDTSQHPFKFFSMLLSVGLCEELIKLLPVIGMRREAGFRNFLFVGAMSGLGFGIAEGVLYSVFKYTDAPVGTYFLRFASVALTHGVWTVVSSAILYSTISVSKDIRGGWQFAAYLVAVIFLPATIHAFYNAYHYWILFPFGAMLWLSGGAVLLSRWPIGGDITPVCGREILQKSAWGGGAIICLAIVCSCAGLLSLADDSSRHLVGEWRRDKSGVSERLILNSDSSASMFEKSGYSDAESHGTWECDGNTLKLRLEVTFLFVWGPRPPGQIINLQYRIVSITDDELVTERDGKHFRWIRNRK